MSGAASLKRAKSSKQQPRRKPSSATDGPQKVGRPLMGSQAKIRINVMLDPAVADRLRAIGGGNLSLGIELAVKNSSR